MSFIFGQHYYIDQNEQVRMGNYCLIGYRYQGKKIEKQQLVDQWIPIWRSIKKCKQEARSRY